ALTSGLHSERLPVLWLAETMAAIHQSAAAKTVNQLPQQNPHRLKTPSQPGAAPDPQALQACLAACAVLEAEDKRLMAEIKLALRTGLHVFEQFERESIAKGSNQLLAVVKRLPVLLESYYRQVASTIPFD